MKTSSIEKEYRNKIKLLKKYNEYYYEKSDTRVGDFEFDNLKKEILDLEKKH